MADMPGRARTNWVGVVLEAPDRQALADFYSAVRAVAAARELGATLASYQPQENCTVLLDPAGHPFCLYLDE